MASLKPRGVIATALPILSPEELSPFSFSGYKTPTHGDAVRPGPSCVSLRRTVSSRLLFSRLRRLGMSWRANIKAALQKLTGKSEERDAGSDKSPDGKPALGAKQPPPIGFFRLFRFASRKDKLYMAIAALSAAVHGSILPIFTIVRSRNMILSLPRLF